MRKDFSPEEKLLRLIKGSVKKESGKENRKSDSAAGGIAVASSNEKSVRGGQKRTSGFSVFDISTLSAKNANPILVIILVCLSIYFIVDMLHNPYRKKDAEQEFGADRKKTELVESIDSPEPYSYYTAGMGNRNIFLPQETEAPQMFSGSSVEEISANLSLIGIISGDKPQAIIEDKKAGKSYFLYKGGSVGQAKIMDIMEDRVVMEYAGEEFELVL